MNSQGNMYRAEARQTDLLSSAARSRLVARTSTRNWTDRFRAAIGRWHRQPVAPATVAAPTEPRPSIVG